MSKAVSGIKGLAFAELTINDDKTYSYEKPVMVPELEQITVTDTYSESSNYADNKRNIYQKKKTGSDMSIVLTELKKIIEAIITGKKYYKGALLSKTNDVQKEVAVLYQKTYNDGSIDYCIYYNVKLSRDDNNGETDGESTNYQKVTISGKASPLPDDQLDLVIGSDEAEKDEEMKLLIENFYEEVQFLPEGALVSNE